jgi:hypothetical protein
MRKLLIAGVLASLGVATVALPDAASARATHHKHHPGTVKNAPCKGLGIDIALGKKNVCVPL